MGRGFTAAVVALLNAFRLPRMVILVEFNDTAKLNLRLTNWPRNLVAPNGKTYTGANATANKFTLKATGLGERLDFTAPTAVLEIGSLNGWAQAHFFDDLFRENTVTITLLYISGNSFLETGWESTYSCDAEECDDDKVSIRLGSIDAVTGTEVPRRATQESGCQWDFQVSDNSGGCPFRWVDGVHAAALRTCDKSYDGANGCVAHFPDVIDPITRNLATPLYIPRFKPYGAFLGTIDHRLVRGGGG